MNEKLSILVKYFPKLKISVSFK